LARKAVDLGNVSVWYDVIQVRGIDKAYFPVNETEAVSVYCIAVTKISCNSHPIHAAYMGKMRNAYKF